LSYNNYAEKEIAIQGVFWLRLDGEPFRSGPRSSFHS